MREKRALPRKALLSMQSRTLPGVWAALSLSREGLRSWRARLTGVPDVHESQSDQGVKSGMG